MPAATLSRTPAWWLAPPDARALLFSASSLLAAAATLVIVMAASLPRPWWALLTVYVTAQPLAGAFRPKIIYRLIGLGMGAAVAVLLVANMQNVPELLVLAMALWTGLCIYLAARDRSARAFLFQMAAFSAAVIGFPYTDSPADIFMIAVARVSEMGVAITCVTAAHALLQPWSAVAAITQRARRFLADSQAWTATALAQRDPALETGLRQRLASDVTELGLIAIHLPFDQAGVAATRRRIIDLQHTLAEMVPLATAAANRHALLHAAGRDDPRLDALIADVAAWLRRDAPPAEAAALTARARGLAAVAAADWPGLLVRSAATRLAQFLAAHQHGHRLISHLDDPETRPPARPRHAPAPFEIGSDHGIAVLAGLATAAAIILYCAVWILLGWPSGAATAAFAALITCSFAVQDDPAPGISRYLLATLASFPLAALYLFVILPRVDGVAMLITMLAPALLLLGYWQADAGRRLPAMPMLSGFIVGLGLVDRFQPDFGQFLNTALAQLGGIVATLAVTRLFRSASARWSVARILRANGREIARIADLRHHGDARRWTALATDHVGRLAARAGQLAPGDALAATDGLTDLRTGRNLVPIRRALASVARADRARLAAVLAGVASLYRQRQHHPAPPPPALLARIDAAITGLVRPEPPGPETPADAALLALVGLRCTLFASAQGPQP